ncbi:MAG: hypothetical protein K8I27_04610 [Planctomycetes bacterium]|nr:hypothetical protein [Planctomycetota bacterium]
MKYAVLLTLALLVTACPKPSPPVVSGGSASGFAIGNTWDDKPLTVGKGDFAGKGLVITYFATW